MNLFEKMYDNVLIESPQSKIQKYNITDPFYINFIHRYEGNIKWNTIKTLDDLDNNIKANINELVKPENYHRTISSINWVTEILALKAAALAGNEEAQRSLDAYNNNPAEAKEKLINDINTNRDNIVNKWVEYFKNNDIYNDAFKFTILSSILNRANKSIPPPSIIYPATLARIYEKIKENPTETFKIKYLYDDLLKKDIKNNSETVISGNGTWIRIPGVISDPNNINENIDKLMSVSANNWCVCNTTSAELYLKNYGNDFWVYLVEDKEGKDKAVASVRIDTGDNSIQEISGTEGGSSQELHDKYLPIVSDLVEKRDFKGKNRYLIDLLLKQKHYEKLKKLISSGEIDPNAEDGYALTNAAEGHTEIVKFLLQTGVDPNAANGRALRNAVFKGHTEIVNILLQAGADPNAKEVNGLTNAAKNGNTEIVNILLKAGADPNANEGDAFSHAAYKGHTEIVNILLKAGADPNARTGQALRNAVLKGHTEIVNILLQAGADPNAESGLTSRYDPMYSILPLSYAVETGHTEIVKMLLKFGADPNATAGIGIMKGVNGGLTNAVKNGNIEIVKMLLQAGADPNAEDGYALRNAVLNGHTEIVNILLQAKPTGADPNAANGRALSGAAYHGHTELVNILLQAGADPNAANGHALSGAALQGHTEIVKLLKQAIQKQTPATQTSTIQTSATQTPMIQTEETIYLNMNLFEKMYDKALLEAPVFELQGKNVITRSGQQLRNMPLKSVKENIVFFRTDAERGFVAPGSSWVYFMDTPKSAREMAKGDIPMLMIPQGAGYSGGNPITDVWKKKYQKSGTEHIIGIIEGNVTDEVIFINMMSVRKKYQRNRINTMMINAIRKDFPNAKVEYSNPTDEGEKFITQYDPQQTSDKPTIKLVKKDNELPPPVIKLRGFGNTKRLH